jgi:hypothetical protein
MANGKPGDHPVTDVVSWRKEVFAPDTDALIREIAGFTKDRAVFDPFAPVEPLLFDVWADRTRERELHDALVVLRDRLRREPVPPNDAGT